MDMLVKLKESLTELSKEEPICLQTGVITCASKCDEVLQKLKIEKTDTERELESRKARIEELTSKLTRLTEYIHGM
jgi:chaperonin cofactor prefoldin